MIYNFNLIFVFVQSLTTATSVFCMNKQKKKTLTYTIRDYIMYNKSREFFFAVRAGTKWIH